MLTVQQEHAGFTGVLGRHRRCFISQYQPEAEPPCGFRLDTGGKLGGVFFNCLRSVTFVAASAVLVLSNQSLAAPKGSVRSPASQGPRLASQAGPSTQTVDRVLDVKGQSRAWNRLSGVHREREAIDFVQTRTDYRTEIESTKF